MRSRLTKARARLAEVLAEIEASPDQLERTLTRLDDWAAQLREQL